jgi:hypothetical protein
MAQVNKWSVPRIWPDSTVFIIGGGPSLKTMDLTLIHSKRVIGTNFAFKLGNWIDVIYWLDAAWGERNERELSLFPGLKVNLGSTQINVPANSFRMIKGKQYGIDMRPTHLGWNNNSGASAINLAYHFGAKKVVLLGFDMKFGENNENNWHDLHTNPRGTALRPWNPYPHFLQAFNNIKEDADNIGLEIVNCTPNSALTIFPMLTLEEVLEI